VCESLLLPRLEEVTPLYLDFDFLSDIPVTHIGFSIKSHPIGTCLLRVSATEWLLLDLPMGSVEFPTMKIRHFKMDFHGILLVDRGD
jgi:hypothetical protein